MLTPMEIHNHEFKKGFRGYNENEVDDFLDKIVNDYEKILRDNDKLKNQLSINEKEVNNYKNLEKNLQGTISIAQKTAEEIIAAAQKTADEIIAAAKKNSEEMRENATRDTQNIYNNTMKETQNLREKARFTAKKNLEEASRKLRVIVDEYEKIVREKNSFLLKIRTALESELAVTSHLLSAVPNSDELSKLRAMLMQIESENINYLPAVEESHDEEKVEVETKIAEPEKKVEEKPAKKIPEPIKKEEKSESLIEKVSKVVSHAEPIEKTEKPEKNSDEDLEKTLAYKPMRK